jgi:hypothetical protein
MRIQLSALFATAVIATVLPVALAQAQGLEAVSTGIEYMRYDDGAGFTVDNAELSADVAYSFANGIGLQLGIGHLSEIGSSDPFLDFMHISEGEIHLTYDVNEELRLGLLASSDTESGNDVTLGGEALYTGERFRLEGRLAACIDGDYWVAEANSNLNLGHNLSLRNGLRWADFDDDGHYALASVGLGLAITDNVNVYADYSRHENDFGGGSVYHGHLLTAGMKVNLAGDNSRLFSYTPFY